MLNDDTELDDDDAAFAADEKTRIAALHKSAPEVIWLQVDPEAEQFDGWEAQTWCSDQINETDVKYVRADTAQTQLDERDKTILEQQARIAELRYWLEKMQECANWDGRGLRGADEALLKQDNSLSLESALKAERIKTLEDAEIAVETHYFCGKEVTTKQLRLMAAELKDKQNAD